MYTVTSRISRPDWGPGWVLAELPGSAEFLGTARSIKVIGTVDDIPIPSGLMPTSRGYHFLALSARLRKQLGKDVGDEVTVTITGPA